MPSRPCRKDSRCSTPTTGWQLFNRRYVEEIWPQIADILVPGVTFETIIRETIKRGIWDGTDVDLETLVQAALKRHRDLPSVFEISYPNGR